MLEWRERWPQIGDVRGLGSMLAIELVSNAQKRPAPGLATAVIEEARKRGLLLLKAGIHSNCLRVLAPLSIPGDQLLEALEVWEQALATVLG
jgi:4-aminobutyrate aminotransferase/(S)-3-amino-2-methylpropionate transaminase